MCYTWFGNFGQNEVKRSKVKVTIRGKWRHMHCVAIELFLVDVYIGCKYVASFSPYHRGHTNAGSCHSQVAIILVEAM